MFTISHLSATAYTAKRPKRDTSAEGEKEINTALENRCLLCFCLTDKYTEVACLIKLPSLEEVLERLALLTEPLVT